MSSKCRMKGRAANWTSALLLSAVSLGCHTVQPAPGPCPDNLPKELEKLTMPPYVIESPDILLIDAIRVIPLPPYRIDALDTLFVQVSNALQGEPIAGLYVVETDGKINLGTSYRSVKVIDLTIPEAKKAIENHLKNIIKDPNVFVAPGQTRGMQQIRGEHLVRPDGTVSLGLYGSVRVTGLTLPAAKAAIEAHLSRYLLKPEVSVDVAAYNSKVLYVVYDGGGLGQQVTRLPITGNETVLDAIGQLNGLLTVSDQRRIWVSRPAPAGSECDQVLPVDWVAITTRGRTETNYQLLPGDRLYVQAEPLVSIDTYLSRLFSPMERVFGVTLLGRGTVGALAQPLRSNGTSTTGLGGF
jgi:polysaccharide export outer membrane protein